jgi:D-glycero-alpha-D-manno-heptose 1-phosphate guanylyltransferase
MTREAIVLAGGFGTRLKSVVADLPKPMAPVAGAPFLDYILRWLETEGVTRVVLAVGHLREVIISHYGHRFGKITIVYSEELEPLGTGGGIRKACDWLEGETAFVINGDTFFNVSLAALEAFHLESKADLTLALKPMQHFDRYGTVETNEEGMVTGFQEKRFLETGNINGGIYCLNKAVFPADLPPVFSFEKEILEKYYPEGKIFGMISDTYFIDIGIPEDYARAQIDFANHSNEEKKGTS